MPIDYKQYHPKWKLISWLIRVRRAKNKCEWCGVKNNKWIVRKKNRVFEPDMHRVHNLIKKGWTYNQSMKIIGATKVILTVAHIDHNKDNNRFHNLEALCQKCHLNHDIKQHCDNRKYGRNWKGKHQLKLNF